MDVFSTWEGGYSRAVGFVRGKTYHRPALDDAWCLDALDEILRTRTFVHPIRVRLTMSDGRAVSGHLQSVEGRLVIVDMPSENQAVTVHGDEIEAFYLLPDPLAGA